MIFSCVVPFESKEKKIPDLSLPPCICNPPPLLQLKVEILYISLSLFKYLPFYLQKFLFRGDGLKKNTKIGKKEFQKVGDPSC
jgi:hypothetical protein